MARDPEHEIMVLGGHRFHVRAKQMPERGEPFDRGRFGARRRRKNAPALDEQLGESGVGT